MTRTMTRTEQYLEEAQSFLDKGHFTLEEKERLSVLRDIAQLEALNRQADWLEELVYEQEGAK